MIFVTVGTERFPFDRLIRAADAMCDVLGGEEIYMQIGRASYTPRCPHRDFLPYEKVVERLNRARIVVGHAGVGTLLMCARFDKVPVMMARRRRYGEHVDDHQQLFAERMANSGSIILAREPGELRDCILRYDERLKTLGPRVRPESSLAGHLRTVLDRLSGQGGSRA